MTDETDSSWVLSQAEYDALVAFRERTVKMLGRVFVDDHDAMQRTIRVLRGTQSDDGEHVVLSVALDQVLDERDRAREAAARLRRLAGGRDSYTVALIEGRA